MLAVLPLVFADRLEHCEQVVSHGAGGGEPFGVRVQRFHHFSLYGGGAQNCTQLQGRCAGQAKDGVAMSDCPY